MTLADVFSLLFSFSALAVSLAVYYYLKREIDENREMIKETSEAPEEEVDSSEGSVDPRQEVERDAEELFQYLKGVHGFEEVTTYTEIVNRIQEMDVEDNEMKEKLLDFYDRVIRMEYSREEMNEEEVETLKDEASDLAKTLEGSREERE